MRVGFEVVTVFDLTLSKPLELVEVTGGLHLVSILLDNLVNHEKAQEGLGSLIVDGGKKITNS